MTRAAFIGGVLLAWLCLASVAGASARVRGVTTEVSGVMPESPVAMSSSGRYVVVAGGAVYVHDRRTGRVTAADVTPDGDIPDGPSGVNPGGAVLHACGRQW